MKNLTKIIITLFLLFAYTYSLTTGQSKAENVAISWYKNKSGLTNVVINDIIEKEENGRIVLYIFKFASGGFVIVSGNDATQPVFGYSINSVFSENNSTPGFDDWMQLSINYVADCFTLNKGNSEYADVWDDILNNESQNTGNPVIGPLLTTKWGQKEYYNELCHEDQNGYGGHAKVGCVATAMAQIMNYHEHPQTGKGANSYNGANYYNGYSYGNISANFEEGNYNYSNMPDSIYSCNLDIAKLCFHAGVSVNMMYGPNSSGAYSSDVDNALRDHFYYDCSYLQESNRTKEEWDSILVSDLNNYLPIYYSGCHSSSCHAYVCDGYDGDYRFHFNWGNYGINDGWFASDSTIYYRAIQIVNNIRPVEELIVSNININDRLLGGTLSVNNLSTPEVDFPNIQSGDYFRFYSDEFGYYDFETNTQNILHNDTNYYHLNWNRVASEYAMIWSDVFVDSIFSDDGVNAIFNTRKSMGRINTFQIQDPWYQRADGAQTGTDWIDVNGNYDVFLNQGGIDFEPPYYSVRTLDDIIVTQDGIYEFVGWKAYKPDGSEDVNNDYVSFEDTSSLETGVVFHQEGGKIKGVEAVNMRANYTLTIANNESLTIPAGANFTCAEGFTIEVEGELEIIGTESEPIILTSASSNKWGGIVVNSETGLNNLEYCHIEDALVGIDYKDTYEQGVQSNNNVINLQNNKFSNCDAALNISNNFNTSVMNIKNNEFINNGDCIYIDYTDHSNEQFSNSVNIRKNVFYNNMFGLLIYDIYAPTNLNVYNNTFNNNEYSYGRYSWSNEPVNFINNIVTNGTYELDFLPSIDVHKYNNVWNVPNINLGEGSINQNPQYISSTDYHLTATSLCIDAGDPDSPNDDDETRADIGAYYLPHTLITGDVHGDINGLTIFEGNDVTITDDIEVESDATMYVRPGTVIEVEAGSRIKVYGELRAEGTSSNKIKFICANGDWTGIVAISNSTVYLNHTEISDAYVGLHADNANSVNVYNSEFSNSVAGIWMNNCNSNHIDNNTFINNSYCGLFLTYTTTNLDGNVISNNNNAGIEGSRVYGSYKYNTINDNHYGIYLYDNSAPDLTLTRYFPDLEYDFRNNIIAGNDYGVYIYGGYPQLGNYVLDMGDLMVTGGFNEFNNVDFDVYNEDDEVDARLNIWESNEIYGDVEIEPTFYRFLDDFGLGKTAGDDKDFFENAIYTVADSLIADSLFAEAMEEYESLIEKMPNEDISKKTLVNIVALNRRLFLDSLYLNEFTDKSLVGRLEKISNKYPNTPVGDLSLDMQVTGNIWSGNYDKAITLGNELYSEYAKNGDNEKSASILYEQFSALKYKAETNGDLSKTSALIKQSKAKADLILSQYSETSVANAVRLSRGLTPIMIDTEPKTNTIPKKFALHNCYPNPFNPVTNIGFDLPKDSKISLIAYDVMGRKVWEYENNGTVMDAGKYEIQWDGKTTEKRQLASGIYLIQLRTAGFVDVKKVVLLK